MCIERRVQSVRCLPEAALQTSQQMRRNIMKTEAREQDTNQLECNGILLQHGGRFGKRQKNFRLAFEPTTVARDAGFNQA